MVDVDQLVQQARQLLLSNRRVGVSRWGQRYSFVCPSPVTYPYQWFWDSCFHAIALSHIEPEMAKQELTSLLSIQEPSGFIPHVIFWTRIDPRTYWIFLESAPSIRPRHTALIQPPVLAQAVEAVFQRTEDVEFLRQVLPGVRSYYGWLAEHRDPDGDGLISIVVPYESGLDEKPAYEIAIGRQPSNRGSPTMQWRRLEVEHLRDGWDSKRILASDRFNVEDVLVNCVYAEGLRAASRLSRVVGDSAEARSLRGRADQTEAAVLQKCYDARDGLFYDLYSRRELKARVKTVTCLLPVMLDGIAQTVLRRLVADHLLNPEEFWLPYPVPSVAASEPSFSAGPGRFQWRGPTWVNTNWFIVKGLWKHGYQEIARTIAQRTVEMVWRSGFWEYYDPYSGGGYGARSFGWSTLVVDMLEEAGLR